jgi:hypothetical protein
MALVDTTFAPIPEKLLNQWGVSITYVKAATTQTYNTTTGTVSGSDTNVSLKGLIMTLRPEETNGDYQRSDLKVIIGNKELGDYYPTVRDRIQYTEAGSTKTARIVEVMTSRGDKPILHTLVARPQ